MSAAPSAPLVVLDLGRQAYGETLALQREIAHRRIKGTLTDDVLVLVEHEPVVTLGRATRPENLPVPRAQLERQGIEWYEVERGGDVTFHNPGQLVGYPILDLQRHRQDVHWYLRRLETALIAGLRRLAIPAEPNPGFTGVWTRGRKIASIGIHVRRWVTFHGFALNVMNDLTGFGLIVPCGIRQVTMTSVERELGRPAWAATRDAIIAAFGHVFGLLPRSAESKDWAELSAGSDR